MQEDLDMRVYFPTKLSTTVLRGSCCYIFYQLPHKEVVALCYAITDPSLCIVVDHVLVGLSSSALLLYMSIGWHLMMRLACFRIIVVNIIQTHALDFLKTVVSFFYLVTGYWTLFWLQPYCIPYICSTPGAELLFKIDKDINYESLFLHYHFNWISYLYFRFQWDLFHFKFVL